MTRSHSESWISTQSFFTYAHAESTKRPTWRWRNINLFYLGFNDTSTPLLKRDPAITLIIGEPIKLRFHFFSYSFCMCLSISFLVYFVLRTRFGSSSLKGWLSPFSTLTFLIRPLHVFFLLLLLPPSKRRKKNNKLQYNNDSSQHCWGRKKKLIALRSWSLRRYF